jgi:hypothetical protein
MGASTSHYPKGLRRLLQGQLYLYRIYYDNLVFTKMKIVPLVLKS